MIGKIGWSESDNSGAEWLRFIEFDIITKKISFYISSILLNKYAGRNGEKTFGIPPEYSEFKLDFPPQLIK